MFNNLLCKSMANYYCGTINMDYNASWNTTGSACWPSSEMLDTYKANDKSSGFIAHYTSFQAQLSKKMRIFVRLSDLTIANKLF